MSFTSAFNRAPFNRSYVDQTYFNADIETTTDMASMLNADVAMFGDFESGTELLASYTRDLFQSASIETSTEINARTLTKSAVTWGMKINEVDIESIGFSLDSRSLPVLPPTEDNTIKLAGNDGLLDFGTTYTARPINVTLYCFATDYHGALARLAALLNVRNTQIYVEFADLVNKRYPVVYNGTLDVQATGSRTVNLPLKMNDPWAQSLRDTVVKEYGQGLECGQGYTYSDYAQYFNTSGTMLVRNEGTLPQSPIIRVSGAFTNLSISNGVSALTITGVSAVNDVWEINCEKFTVKKNGVNAYGSSNGVFFTLNPGNTTFIVTGTSLACSVAFEFRYKYLY